MSWVSQRCFDEHCSPLTIGEATVYSWILEHYGMCILCVHVFSLEKKSF